MKSRSAYTERMTLLSNVDRQLHILCATAGVVMEVIEGGGREDVARRLGVSVATV
jgi:hypothetical protein